MNINFFQAHARQSKSNEDNSLEYGFILMWAQFIYLHCNTLLKITIITTASMGFVLHLKMMC
jgi:hypothetical protein